MSEFERFDLPTDDGVWIHGVRAGKGPAVLLLHGHPQSHVTWHAVAPALLAAGYCVIATDLRGYGDSSRTAGGKDHVNYSKRTLARDQVSIMRVLGHERFSVIGHDRGGRVAHRMALDHAGVLDRVAVLDIAPTATMYARTNQLFATRYFWWFFLIQPAPLPERMIEADTEFFLRNHLAAQSRTPGVPGEALIQEYLRCYRVPGTVHAICEDYRAAAGIDLEHDAEDAAQRIRAPPARALGSPGSRWAAIRRARDLAREGDQCAGRRPRLRSRSSRGIAGRDLAADHRFFRRRQSRVEGLGARTRQSGPLRERNRPISYRTCSHAIPDGLTRRGAAALVRCAPMIYSNGDFRCSMFIRLIHLYAAGGIFWCSCPRSPWDC